MATRSKLSKANSRTIGFRAVHRNLQKYGVAVSKELLDIQRAAAEQTAADAWGGAPRDSGELGYSVTMVQEGKRFRVGTDKKQGFFQEFGTQHQDAQPWLYPALRRAKPKYESDLKLLHDKAMRGINPNEKD